MEQALSEVCKDVRIGKILIQNNIETGEPEVIGVLIFFSVELFFHLNFLVAIKALLSAPSSRHQRLPCYPHGCHCGYRSCCNDGNPCFTGSRRSGRKYFGRFPSDGRFRFAQNVIVPLITF